MIIDIHGHYTTEPAQLFAFRKAQLNGENAVLAPIGDDELRESVEPNQLRVLRERGGDLMVLSPRASGMEHHVPHAVTANAWARVSNDLVHRVSELYPEHFAPVAQLPQTPDGNFAGVIAELRRTVTELGFVGANLNPDPSGTWAGKPLTDESWFGLYEVIQELDIPVMIHVSTACNPNFHTLGAHYLNADTSVFMQLLQSDLFQRFPGLRFVIPHGGGAVPYHWGRYRGLSMRNGWQDPSELLANVYFDTAVYHQPGIDLLTRVIPAGNILFASEMLGAVRGADPDSGVEWDHTLVYVKNAGLSPEDELRILRENAVGVYPGLAARIAARR
ncbi:MULTISPECIES: amidohydrolase family protein [Paenarthrobacter]|uniref:Amidohydrolase n=1 Tax=Paenarthrobacter ureafaciens TaxID=37931 RepID=A0AAX3EJ05_PAEUR|nr:MULTISPECIES: amidohydrolase family protein [Paenarthrobacter]NKR11349.1 4-oxalomesaconate hydratase [Arthrobacter sp. M5]NKR16645.1 4-oxalomesaconate hydratase [Arthrobacter sp. M6]OEH57860.1 4-oxalomesaconate hydratase [Arthrobacter sp. D2]OEH65084.1 4-oxalomesaconate hydratase [Arthrobacter sp. D4]MDO5866754.1 amidohydrolase [Paenarthrobacter sp. SD-2]